MSYVLDSQGRLKIADQITTIKSEVVILEDQKSSGSNGGTKNSGVNNRDLNTIVHDDTGQVTLASNDFTLPLGDWTILASVPGYKCDFHQGELYNVDTASVVKRGSSEFAGNTLAQTRSFIKYRVSLTSSTTYRIRHYSSNSQGSDGMGNAASNGGEVYTQVVAIREKDRESPARLPKGSTLPTNPEVGDKFLLIPDPIFRAQINGAPSNGATTITVDNITVGAIGDTHLGMWLYNATREVEVGQIDAQGSGSTLNVLARQWSTEGWADDDVVEVRAKDSVWTYTQRGWQTEFIDYVEWNWTTNKSVSSTSYVAIGENLYFVAPTECDVKFQMAANAYDSSGNEWITWAVKLDGGSLHYLGGFYGSNNGFHTVNFVEIKGVAAGSHEVELWWRKSGTGSHVSRPGDSPDYYNRKTSVLLRKQ